jgi:hypothetical protein
VADGLASIRALIQHQPISLLVQVELTGDFGREAHERRPDIGRLDPTDAAPPMCRVGITST